MSRNQKLILGVLAIVDLIVIGGLAAIVIGSMRQPMAPTLMPTPTLTVTPLDIPTWTPTATSTPAPTLLPQPTRTPRPTRTPFPTATATPLPTPGPVELENPEFEQISFNEIPGWKTDAFVNYEGGGDYDPQNSYAEPSFAPADDPIRRINGSTLKIETVRWLKFRAFVYQQITVTTGSTAYFQVKANAFSSIDELILRAGVDPNGGEGCAGARWGEVIIDQDDGVVTITSPRVIVGEPGRLTVCLYAEPRYPDVSNAAFFDQAELIVSPPRP
mgnify:CR=1 FL=1